MLLALAVVVFWGATFLNVANRNIGIDKDWLNLYLCGIETVHPALHENQIEMVKDIVSESTSDQAVYRATLRANYCDNYPFTSLSMVAAGEWQKHLGTRPSEDFSTFLSRTLWSGVIISGEVLGIVCLLFVFLTTTGAVRLSLLMAIGLCGWWYLALPSQQVSWMFYQVTPAPPAMIVDWPNIAALGLRSWINPGAAYSLFSAFPRCLCAMLAFTAFAIRWSGRPAAAYWIPLLVSFVHQSSASILLFGLICCDIVIRPWIFKQVSCLVPIAAIALVVLLRERMLAILGFSWWWIAAAALTAVGVAIFILVLRPVRELVRGAWSHIVAWRQQTIEAVPLPFADASILFAVWFVLLLISYIVSRSDVWFRVIYFWSELTPRYVGMFQLVVVAGFMFPLAVVVQSRWPRAVRFGAVCIAVLMLIAGASQLGMKRSGVAAMTMMARAQDAKSLKTDSYAGPARPDTRDETTWYYLLLRSALVGDRSIDAFFGKT